VVLGLASIASGMFLFMAELWDESNVATRVVECLSVVFMGLAFVIGCFFERWAVFEWLALATFGAIPFMIALSINPSAPDFP